MSKIHLLPPEIIARIAAGEVIERPAYAVKELLENSIDAVSTAITIQIVDAGLTKITVIDNGDGMDKEDLLESFRPHTTSKIIGDTLHSIKTLGFRGEALSSIAAISNMTIASRIKYAETGIQVTLTAGVFMQVSPIGMPPGTVVTVENLFYTVPARKKFLKSTRTEFRHIVDLVTHYALSHPHIHFTLTHNKKIILDLTATTDTLERVKSLLGNHTFTNLIPVKYQDGYVKLSGFVGKPQLATYTLDKHYLFVNKRKVGDRLISQAIKESYGNLLESTAYPIAIIFLEMPFEMVDVNVHPRKEQIAIHEGKVVYDTLSKAVSQTLTDHNLTFHNASWKEDFSEGVGRKGNMGAFAPQLLRESVTPWTISQEKDFFVDQVFQINNLYIVAQSSKGLFIVDQHAAHERILYEQYEDEYRKQQKIIATKHLKKGVLLDLSIADFQVVQENLKLFTNLGFLLEEFGTNKFMISAVPQLFENRNIEVLIQEIIDDIRDERVKNIDNRAKRMLSYLACRSAIMAGDPLTQAEGKNLIEKLQTCQLLYTCPHGRPTMIELKATELDKWFKRS